MVSLCICTVFIVCRLARWLELEIRNVHKTLALKPAFQIAQSFG